MVEVVALIQPHAPSVKTDRPPLAVETKLHIHFMRQWFGLSIPYMEEALCDELLYYGHAQLDPNISR